MLLLLRSASKSCILRVMRKLLPILGVLAVLSLCGPKPVGPSNALAVDDPAFSDGGSIVTFNDGGSTITIDTAITSSWQMAIRCDGQAARYKMCESCTGTDPSTCRATAVNQKLNADTTYDIAVPANRRCLSLFSDDAGTISCTVNRVTPRNLPEQL